MEPTDIPLRDGPDVRERASKRKKQLTPHRNTPHDRPTLKPHQQQVNKILKYLATHNHVQLKTTIT
jgi:hypothetical protein